MEETECSETSAYKIQTLENYPEENTTKPLTFDLNCLLLWDKFLYAQEDNWTP